MENIILGVNFSEHLSGFRAYSLKALQTIPFQRFSNDFVFDQQFMAAAVARDLRVGETAVPVRYYHDSSSIQLIKGGKFLGETFLTLLLFLLDRWGLVRSKLFH